MPAVRTEITEIATALGLSGAADLDTALAHRPPALHGVDDLTWQRVVDAHHDRAHRLEFHAAWANGRAFLHAVDGLRGRLPLRIEWKGPQRAPGDLPVPADLRVDHVWLVSCKYLSKVLANRAPAAVFGGPGDGDWFVATAPDPYQALWHEVRLDLGAVHPPRAADLGVHHRRDVATLLRGGWTSPGAEVRYAELCAAVSQASADRWRQRLRSKRAAEDELWALLRIGPTPYFVLGAARERSLRLRVMTAWDWRQAFELRRFEMWSDDAGQPQVRWRATVRRRDGGGDRVADGHVEIRWSHGRFGAPPEAKVYLDTPHHHVPGYVELT